MTENIINALKIMGLGMLAIFIVAALIVGFVYLLNAITGSKKNSDEHTE